MPGRDEGLWVFWPHYFDQRLSRADGRRVPANLAVAKPDSAWLQSAAKKAGMDATLIEDARHPSASHKVVGCITVAKGDNKEAALREIAAQMQA